jgi:hypothetical protein
MFRVLIYVRPPQPGRPPLNLPGPSRNTAQELGKFLFVISAILVHTPGSEPDERFVMGPALSPPTNCIAYALVAASKSSMQAVFNVEEQEPSSSCPLRTVFCEIVDSRK